jgi:hypothetical protein
LIKLIEDILKSFEEMADLVLMQLTLLDKYMSGEGRGSEQDLLDKIRQNEKDIEDRNSDRGHCLHGGRSGLPLPASSSMPE